LSPALRSNAGMVFEPSFVIKRRNDKQTGGRRLALRASPRPQLELWLGGLAWRSGWFRPRPSTSLQLARLVERITRYFGEKRLTGAVFLDVAKAFDTVWIECLLYKLTLLNFPSYIVHTISSYLTGRTFEASFQTGTSSRRGMRAGVAQGGLISPVLFSLNVNDMPSPSHYAELALYADDTSVIATSRKPTLLVSYLGS